MKMNKVQISLKTARMSAGLTLEEVSGKLKVSTVTIKNWENGKTQPRISDAKKLSKLYNIALDDIFFEYCIK